MPERKVEVVSKFNCLSKIAYNKLGDQNTWKRWKVDVFWKPFFRSQLADYYTLLSGLHPV